MDGFVSWKFFKRIFASLILDQFFIFSWNRSLRVFCFNFLEICANIKSENKMGVFFSPEQKHFSQKNLKKFFIKTQKISLKIFLQTQTKKLRLNKSAQKNKIIEFKFCEENEKYNKIKKRALRFKKGEGKQTNNHKEFFPFLLALSTFFSFLKFSTRYQSARINHKFNVKLSKPHLHSGAYQEIFLEGSNIFFSFLYSLFCPFC